MKHNGYPVVTRNSILKVAITHVQHVCSEILAHSFALPLIMNTKQSVKSSSQVVWVPDGSVLTFACVILCFPEQFLLFHCKLVYLALHNGDHCFTSWTGGFLDKNLFRNGPLTRDIALKHRISKPT